MDDWCRLCLKNEDKNESVFSHINGFLIVDLIKTVINLKIYEADNNLPKQICTKCLSIVVNASELRELSFDNEKYLNTLCEETLFKVEEIIEPDCSPVEVIPEVVVKTKGLSEKDAVSCFVCNKVLSRKSLARHMKVVHNQNDFRKKDYDAKRFYVATEQQLEQMPSADSKSTETYFVIKESPAKTEPLKHQTRTKSCKHCRFEFESFSSINDHMKIVHAKLYSKEQEIKSQRAIGCSFCVDRRFATFRLMKIHIQQAHDVDPDLLLYYCSHCTFTTNDKSAIEVHIKEQHFGVSGKPHQCVICDLRFMDPKNLRKHLLVKHKVADSNTLFCDKCDFNSLRRSKLELHMNRVHLKTVSDFLCNFCNIVSKTSHENSLHHFAHCDIVEALDPDLELLSCTMCGTQCSDDDELMQHLLIHEDEADSHATACILCSKVISSFSQIHEHTQNHHLDKLSHRCLECNRCFVYGVKFLIHVRNHKEKKPLIHLCTECGRNFPSAPLLKKHTKIDHEKIYKCPYCDDVVYKSVTAFRQHIDGHTNTRKYQCPLCPKSYSIRNKFKSHYAFHLNDKMNACPICGKGFEKSSSLKVHMQRHDGTLVKRHSCGFCDKKFRSGWARDCHERTHTKEKPFKCEFCSSAYSQKGDYMKHLKVHLGENVYQCSDCPDSFRLLQDLNFHRMNNHHV